VYEISRNWQKTAELNSTNKKCRNKCSDLAAISAIPAHHLTQYLSYISKHYFPNKISRLSITSLLQLETLLPWDDNQKYDLP
jgi:hypothetical protein